VNDPTSRPGYFGCDAKDTSSAGASPGAGTDVDRPVTTIMQRSVVAFRADVPVSAARAELLDRAIPGAPVVDRDGHSVGVLTYAELLRAAEVGAPPSALVGDVMLRRAFAVADTAPIAEVAAVMAAEGVTLVPVVARDGRVVGIVTALDLVEWLAAKEDRGTRPLP
jgi:CBS domain-containing protein